MEQDYVEPKKIESNKTNENEKKKSEISFFN